MEYGDDMLIGAQPSSFFSNTTRTASAVGAANRKNALSRYGEQNREPNESHKMQEEMLRLAREGGAVRKVRKAGFNAGPIGIHYEESSLDVDTKRIDLEQTKKKARAFQQQQEVAGVRNMVAARAVSAYTSKTPTAPDSPAMRTKATAAYTSVAKGTTTGYSSTVPNMIKTTV